MYRVIETIKYKRSPYWEPPVDIAFYTGASQAEAIAAVANAIAYHDECWTKLLSVRMEIEEGNTDEGKKVTQNEVV